MQSIPGRGRKKRKPIPSLRKSIVSPPLREQPQQPQQQDPPPLKLSNVTDHEYYQDVRFFTKDVKDWINKSAGTKLEFAKNMKTDDGVKWFVEKIVRKALEKTGLDPKDFITEVTSKGSDLAYLDFRLPKGMGLQKSGRGAANMYNVAGNLFNIKTETYRLMKFNQTRDGPLTKCGT